MRLEEKHWQEPNKELIDEESPLPKVEEPSITYQKQRYSYADYITWADDQIREIIDGVIYAFSAPMRIHAATVISFLKRVLPFISKRKVKCKIYTAPFDVRLPLNGERDDHQIFNVVQPDIVVVCDPAKLDEKGCIGAPDLVVEIISQSTSKRDLNEKFSLYEKAGVPEYWVVYPQDKGVTVYLLQSDGKYNEGAAYQITYGTNKVPVQTLEGLVIDLEELFEEE